ncbi:hypothetical protein TNCV_4438481 [Trichonephila clavipes]|nr:hypothetical protein TNCV_4438481 [Trichonephila clavipes]
MKLRVLKYVFVLKEFRVGGYCKKEKTVHTLSSYTATNSSDNTVEKIELRDDLKRRTGLAVSLEIICHNCGESTSTISSKISYTCYDINLRLIDGMRAIGKGGTAARIFRAHEFASTTCKV